MTGSTFYHSGMVSNFTANFTNVPDANNRIVTFALILDQGSTGYFANAVQVNGSAQRVRFSANTLPVSNSNVIEVQTVSLIRNNAVWYVLSAVNPYA